jgi:hypothetical protein
MNEKYLKILEFDKIKDILSNYAISENAKDKIEKLEPSTRREVIELLLEQTSEAQKIIVTKGAIPFGSIYDVRLQAKKASIGSILDAKSLIKVKETLRTARISKSYIEQFDNIPVIRSLSDNIRVSKSIEDEIERAIISEMEISDDASAELRRIRRQMANEKQSIKNKLNEIVTSSKYAKILQDTVVTVRNERFVLPVKSENKDQFPGIVHDTSSSGATLFIEPMAIVNMNNHLSALKQEEYKEIERILAYLTSIVGEFSEEIIYDCEMLEELDFIMAKGKLSVSMDAIEPKINQDKYVRFVNARHPLIEKNKVVSSTIEIGKTYSTLVITGPNTGGKTVTLKTLGLLCIMLQCGLHIPCDIGSSGYIFNNIFADIGDEQSIAQSLSTFSAHMTNIVGIMNEVDENSLVLFDELGAGTDPVEGAGLAISILDTLKEKDILTAATTHYSELKNYALTVDKVTNASVEFDVNTLSPTYRLIIGIPGKSNAFEISQKLGLSTDIIQRARDTIHTESIRVEDVISKLDKIKNEYEEKKQRLEKELEDAEFIRLKLENKERRAQQNSEKLLEEAKNKARSLVEEAKNEADEINKILNKLKKSSDYKNIDQKMNEIKGRINTYKDKYAKKKEELVKSNEKPIENVEVGDTVYVNSFSQNAKVLSVDDKKNEVVVQLGAIKMTLKKENISLEKKDKDTKGSKSGKIMKNKAQGATTSVDLRGMDLETALMEVDKHIDDSYLAGLEQLTIIHGVGTLVLKKGVQSYLKKHKHIKNYRDGQYGEGGMGVTIVTLK